jgi:hypothetical protein
LTAASAIEFLANLQQRLKDVALVFTVDESDVRDRDRGLEWTPAGAGTWMETVLRDEGLSTRWALRACAAAPSPYFGAAATSPDIQARNGLFVASLIELLSPAGG